MQISHGFFVAKVGHFDHTVNPVALDGKAVFMSLDIPTLIFSRVQGGQENRHFLARLGLLQGLDDVEQEGFDALAGYGGNREEGLVELLKSFPQRSEEFVGDDVDLV